MLILVFFGCGNRYNDMISWTESIPMGASIQDVQKVQPDYLEINWERPDTIPTYLSQNAGSIEVMYNIEVKWDYDVLNMQNLLVFINGEYVGREARK